MLIKGSEKRNWWLEIQFIGVVDNAMVGDRFDVLSILGVVVAVLLGSGGGGGGRGGGSRRRGIRARGRSGYGQIPTVIEYFRLHVPYTAGGVLR